MSICFIRLFCDYFKSAEFKLDDEEIEVELFNLLSIVLLEFVDLFAYSIV